MAAEKENLNTVTNEELTAEQANDAEVKTDCFAYRECKVDEYACSALNNLYCRFEKCGFYKTKEQFDEDLRKAEGRKKK